MIKLINAKIHTMNALQPTAEALAFEKGVITCCGSNDEVLHYGSTKARIIDLEGNCILPGITDAHIHLLQYGQKLELVDCETQSKAACLTRVAQRIQKTPPGEWICGQGWNHNIWEDGIGSKEELDALSTQHPIYLASKSLHSSWVNSTALQLAGVNENTPSPSGGTIVRNEHGKPSGILLESASSLVEEKIPDAGQVEKVKSLLQAQESLLRFGITGVHDVDTWGIFSLLEDMTGNGSFQLRVVKSISYPALQDVIRAGLHSGSGNFRLRVGWLKLFMDGALGPQTASMLDAYENDKSAFGMLTMSIEELVEIGKQACANDISLEVHAIGDRANRAVLQGIAQITKSNQVRSLPLPHRIEHVQIIHPDDMNHMAKLGVIASMQPIHVLSDMETAQKYWGDRCSYAYAWNSIHRDGIQLVFGSDAPVESPNPFWGLYAAVGRRVSPQDEAWLPELALDMRTALQAYTLNPASIAGQKDHLGSITKGKLADLIICEEDPFTCSLSTLKDMLPITTIIHGKACYDPHAIFQ